MTDKRIPANDSSFQKSYTPKPDNSHQPKIEPSKNVAPPPPPPAKDD